MIALIAIERRLRFGAVAVEMGNWVMGRGKQLGRLPFYPTVWVGLSKLGTAGIGIALRKPGVGGFVRVPSEVAVSGYSFSLEKGSMNYGVGKSFKKVFKTKVKACVSTFRRGGSWRVHDPVFRGCRNMRFVCISI